MLPKIFSLGGKSNEDEKEGYISIGQVVENEIEFVGKMEELAKAKWLVLGDIKRSVIDNPLFYLGYFWGLNNSTYIIKNLNDENSLNPIVDILVKMEEVLDDSEDIKSEIIDRVESRKLRTLKIDSEDRLIEYQLLLDTGIEEEIITEVDLEYELAPLVLGVMMANEVDRKKVRLVGDVNKVKLLNPIILKQFK